MRRRGSWLAFLVLAVVAACGPANTSSPAPATIPATPSPAPSVAVPSFVAAQAAPMALPLNGGLVNAPLPQVSSLTGSSTTSVGGVLIGVPRGGIVPAGAEVAVGIAPAVAAGPAADVPALAALRRSSAGLGGTAVTPLYYISLQFSFSGTPFTLSVWFWLPLVPEPAGYAYGLAAYDPSIAYAVNWNLAYAFGPEQVAVGTPTVTFVPANPTLLVYPNAVYWFAVYTYPPTVTATPTPIPAVVPRTPATATPLPDVSPAQGQVNVGGSPVPLASPSGTGSVDAGGSPIPFPSASGGAVNASSSPVPLPS